jgi:hypothetical protein
VLTIFRILLPLRFVVLILGFIVYLFFFMIALPFQKDTRLVVLKEVS